MSDRAVMLTDRIIITVAKGNLLCTIATLLLTKLRGYMAKAIKLSDQLVAEATRYARVFHRPPPKQIEHWATIGRVAEENPDLPFP